MENPEATATSPPATTAPSAAAETAAATESPSHAPPRADPLREDASVKLSFVGDCLIATAYGATDRPGSLNWTADRNLPDYFLQKVASYLSTDDFTIANCENVLTDSALSPAPKSGRAFWFRTAAKNAAIFPAGSVEIVSLANNHANDYGAAGFSDSVRALESVGLKVGYNNHPVVVEKNGMRVGILCCDIWQSGHYERTLRQLRDLETSTDVQIVYFHGGTEGLHSPERWKVDVSRRLADAGADLVIGGHPHVLQPMEVFHGVPIVYSLGNFVFGGNTRPENRTVIFQAVISWKDGAPSVSYTIIPCYVYTGGTNNWQPAPITDEKQKIRVLEFMQGTRSLPD